MSKGATINKKITDTEIKQNNISKVSSQGVRDYPIDNKTKQVKNEDLDDVYEHVSSNTPILFDTNKEAVSNPPIMRRKKRFANRNRSLDLDMDPFDYEGRDFIYHQYNTDIDTFTPEEKIQFVENENVKMLEKVNQLSEALKSVLDKIKTK